MNNPGEAAYLLPVEHHHVVFTLPAAVADLALANPVVVYNLLFKAAAPTLRDVAADPKHLGAQVGVLATRRGGAASWWHPAGGIAGQRRHVVVGMWGHAPARPTRPVPARPVAVRAANAARTMPTGLGPLKSGRTPDEANAACSNRARRLRYSQRKTSADTLNAHK
jgi:hypothetical protein